MFALIGAMTTHQHRTAGSAERELSRLRTVVAAPQVDLFGLLVHGVHRREIRELCREGQDATARASEDTANFLRGVASVRDGWLGLTAADSVRVRRFGGP